QHWRFPDEPVRHKILDFICDLSLSGIFINAHFIVFKGSHKHHVEFSKLLAERGIWGDEMDIKGIMEKLPHRYPFLLVDKIVHIDDKRAVGIKNITINEEFFNGHFPGEPVMPGVLQVECMAQVAGAVLMERIKGEGLIPLFVGIEDVKFKKVVKPGDTLFVYVYLIRFGGRFAKAKGEIYVNKDLVAEAVITATFVKG
ncbi:MAG: 3-hydroxyacyl-ACP dehydratase FabZ, partial [candidate division WOR-3 bacterium]